MSLAKTGIRILLVLSVSSFLTACMVGPDFHPPKKPDIYSYTKNPLPTKTVSVADAGKASPAQYLIKAADIPSEWWILLHSPLLNQLISTGLANNPNLASAYATLRQAQETLNAQIGNSLFPAFSTQVSGQRQLFTGATINSNGENTIFNLFNANVNVSYSPDVFGGARRQLEALRAQVDYQQFQLIAAYLTLTSNIVTTTVTTAALEGQLKATQQLLHAQEKQLVVIRKQFTLGGASQSNVLTQLNLVEQTRANVPALEKSLAQSYHALAVLVGDFPNRSFPTLSLNQLTLPTKLPVTLPSNLVRQRPDVRASEALLHAASAQIGVATANLFPQFPLTGTYGWQASTPATLFGTTSNAWSIAATLSQPIFQGGALFAQRRAAIAAYDQAFAQYKQTVLKAFQDVADTLRALQDDARSFRSLKQAEIAAKRNVELTTKQYHLGGASYLSLLTAQQQYQQTVVARIKAEAARYNDTAALFQALGGGWWNKPWCVKECLHEG